MNQSDRRKMPLPTPLALSLAIVMLLAAGGTASAQDPTVEFWPELNLYWKTGATTRVYLVAAYAENQESRLGSLDLAGHFDIVLKPVLRRSLREENWQARRYFWVRFGYDHVFKTEDRQAEETSEHRGIVAFHGRTWLPGRIFVEGRLRSDLRWIGADYSTRYRARLEVNRDFVLRGRTWTPYLQIEPFYDTRYNGWARALYQTGLEIELRKYLHRDGRWDFRLESENRAHLRLEPYVAVQTDWLPDESVTLASGIVVRWYY